MPKIVNFPPRSRIVDDKGYATADFLRALEIIINRTGGIGGDAGQDEFTTQLPPFGELDALGLEPGTQPPADGALPVIEAPPQPEDILPEMDIPMVMQPVAASGEAWPVGSIFISVVSTNPSELLGYGTWSAIAAGRVLVGIDAADLDFDTVRETGGSKTAAISAHSGTAVADHPAHTHDFTQSANAAAPDLLAVDTTATGVAASGTTGNPSAVLSHTVTQPSDHSAVSVVQPYYVAYLWERTA